MTSDTLLWLHIATFLLLCATAIFFGVEHLRKLLPSSSRSVAPMLLEGSREARRGRQDVAHRHGTQNKEEPPTHVPEL